jgi:hypothetical protein
MQNQPIHPGGTMASACDFKIIVKGKPSHGAAPWSSVDPIVVSAQIINNLQTIVKPNLNVTENAAAITSIEKLDSILFRKRWKWYGTGTEFQMPKNDFHLFDPFGKKRISRNNS